MSTISAFYRWWTYQRILSIWISAHFIKTRAFYRDYQHFIDRDLISDFIISLQRIYKKRLPTLAALKKRLPTLAALKTSARSQSARSQKFSKKCADIGVRLIIDATYQRIFDMRPLSAHFIDMRPLSAHFIDMDLSAHFMNERLYQRFIDMRHFSGIYRYGALSAHLSIWDPYQRIL
jgi:hypothetical protein